MPPSSSPGCARSSWRSASTTATWKRAACAATPTSRCGRPGRATLGVKAEIKNLNSFRHVQRAIEYEIERQIGVVGGGGTVDQETRLWDAGGGPDRLDARQGRGARLPLFPRARPAAARRSMPSGSMRSAAALPELPDARRRRFVEQYAPPGVRRRRVDRSRASSPTTSRRPPRPRAMPRRRAIG